LKKKILIVLSMYPEEGGKFQYSISMLENLGTLNKDFYDVAALYYSDLWETYLEKFGIRGYEISNAENPWYRRFRKVFVDIFPFLWLWRKVSPYVSRIYRQLDPLKPDLVFYPGGDNLSYELDLPSVIPVFDLMHRYEKFPEVRERSIYRSREKHYRNVCKYAKAILVDSRIGFQHLIECYDAKRERVHILPYIAPSYVRRTEEDVEVVHKHNLPERFIFYPSQLWKHKNHEGVLHAIALLREQDIRVNAVFVGSDKNAGKNIRQLTDKLDLGGQVFLLSFVSNEDLIALYRKAVALVMPTFFGPTNIPPLEAFALGCPVITSNVYGIPQQVGDAALLVDPNSYDDIADKIKTLWSDDNMRRELISRGYQRDKELDQHRFHSTLVSIIEDVLSD